MPNPTAKHPPVKLTKTYIDRIKPGATDEHHWCVDPKGFGLRANPSGKLTFIVQGRIDPRKPPAHITIGPYGVFTVDQARDVARELPCSARRVWAQAETHVESDRYAHAIASNGYDERLWQAVP